MAAVPLPGAGLLDSGVDADSDADANFATGTSVISADDHITEGDVWTLGGEGTGPDADVGAPPTLVDVGGRPAVAVGDKGGTFWALDRLTGRHAALASSNLNAERR